MENNKSLSLRGISAERTKNSAKSADVLSKYFQKWQVIFPNHPTGALALACYLEALADLSPEQLDGACREATRTAEQFPKPGHIRNAVGLGRTGEYLGPPLLTYPEISKEERDEAIKECRKQMGAEWAKTLESLKPNIRKTVTVRPSTLDLEGQKRVLREKGFLK